MVRALSDLWKPVKTSRKVSAKDFTRREGGDICRRYFASMDD